MSAGMKSECTTDLSGWRRYEDENVSQSVTLRG